MCVTRIQHVFLPITQFGIQDVVLARRNLSRYATLDTTFPSTREAKFVNALTEAAQAGDLETFQGAVFEFDQVTKLDNWKTAILLKIKRKLELAGEPDFK
jgi:alpha-soluble NSF attachment protein